MVILGAGLAGCLAGIINKDARILEPSKTIRHHEAVLRFRSDEISKATGIPFQKITVNKGIYDTDVMDFVEPNINLCNQYSLKVTGGISNRSIWDTKPVTRWLAPKDFHDQLLAMLGDRVEIGVDVKKQHIYSQDIISTLPIFVTADLVGEKFSCSKGHSEIYVTKCNLLGCDVHQTVYIPNIDKDYYRATIEGGTLIIESMEPIQDSCIADILEYIFAIDTIHIDGEIRYNMEQPIGKIPEVDNEARQEFIYSLSKKYSIYSLGRMATWRNILLDDVYQDIYRINEMRAKSNYDLALGNTK